MAIGDDFSVAVNGDIRHVANNNHYTVLELHRWLGDMADDQQASGNDLVDITTFTPSARSTDNIIELLDYTADAGPVFNIDDDAAEYFYGGSIKPNNCQTLMKQPDIDGGLVGGAVMALTSEPDEHLDYILVGAASGIIFGAVYGFLSGTRATHAAVDMNNMEEGFNVPTLVVAEHYIKRADERELVSILNVVRYGF